MNKKNIAILGTMLLAACAMGAQAEESVPQLTVASDILGLADTGNKTSLKKDLIYTSGPGDINLYYYNEEGQRVQYENEQELCIALEPVSYTGSAVLDLGDVDDSLIDASGASVHLLDGNSYHADEFILKADRLDGAWEDGKYVYTLQEGDLEWNDWDYDATADYNSDREWSIMGGDGNGVYFFTFEVDGILYDGQEVAPATFPVSVYCYGRTVTDLSLPYEYVENTVDEAYTSGIAQTGEAQWLWHSDNEEAQADEKPHLNDTFTDYVSVIWPEGTDASAVTAEDVTVTLRSRYGDEYVLSTETAYGEHEYTVLASEGETVIAVTYQQWALIPVYSTMEITVSHDGLEAANTFDVASVAAYMVQTGGGGVTIDHTVTCWNYYGIGGMTKENAVNSEYTLSADMDGKTVFYCEDENGNGYLAEGTETTNDWGRTTVTAPEEAWKGDATESYNIAVYGNVAFAETRLENTEEKEVDGQTIVFTQNVSANKSIADILADGAYLEPGFDLNGAGPLQWAWTMRYQSGWTTKSPQPTSLPYIEGAYPYGHEPGVDTEIYLQELEELNSGSEEGPGGPGGDFGGSDGGPAEEGADGEGSDGDPAEE